MTVLLKRLYDIESRKLFPYRAFNIMLLLFGVLFVLGVLFFSSLLFTSFWESQLSKNIFEFKTNVSWNIITYFAGFFNVFLSYAIMMYVCNEYTYRTLRQNVIDGMNPQETLAGKYIMSGLIAIAATLLVALMSVYFEFRVGKLVAQPLGIQYLGLYFLQLLSTLIIAIFFATWMRKTGIAVLLFAASWYLIDSLLYYWILPGGAGAFLPFSSIKDLVHLPGLDELMARDTPLSDSELMAMTRLHLNTNYLTTIAKVVVWDALFIFLTLRMVKTRDM
ncbi:MAG: hypothetical protein KF690_11260 [Bacteroidetes bacterium]|nr:hypothetical protein [Bacteroidota bacterium]